MIRSFLLCRVHAEMARVFLGFFCGVFWGFFLRVFFFFSVSRFAFSPVLFYCYLFVVLLVRDAYKRGFKIKFEGRIFGVEILFSVIIIHGEKDIMHLVASKMAS